MVERIANLFVYIAGDTISELGAAFHEVDGTVSEKAAFLKSQVDSDYRTCRRFRLVEAVALREYDFMARVRTRFELFEELFKPPEWQEPPLNLITTILDNVPAVRRPEEPISGSPGTMVDYLEKYVRDGKFDSCQLINDDLFVPIKLLLNAQHYVSAAKLLMSAIDTVAFIETGDVSGTPSFVLWLQKYVDLTLVGVTAKELWEFRNGLLHMSNLASRAVISGQVPRLILYVGHARDPAMVDTANEKFFSFIHLYEAISAGLGRWLLTYANDHPKFLKFVERYDLTISDARLARSET
jgi:hypothetical protein